MKTIFTKQSKKYLSWIILWILVLPATAQTISGTVSDENGQALPGVNIIQKGTSIGVTTSANGVYSIKIANPNTTLIFSFVGYFSQEIIVGNKKIIDVSLLPQANALEEIVVVGYGTQKKKDLTGSIASADLVAFKESPNVSILQSLKGSLPGLTISQTNRAGDEASINIRGTSTLNGNTSPLIIVDGIIFNGRLSDIAPADVANVDVLKDPSSKAVYGSQAANGVILITTKSGRTATKPTITYSGSYAVSSPTVNAKLLRRDAFLEKIKDINYLKAFTKESGYTVPDPTWTFANSELFPVSLAGVSTDNDFDWYGALTQNSIITNHALSISGGSDKTNYFMSGGYTNEKGFIKNDDYGRYTIRINLDTEVAKWLTLGANTSGSFTNFFKDAPDMNSIVGTNPLVLPKDDNGNYRINPIGDFNVNPFLATENDRYEVENRFVGNFYGIVRIPALPGFSYRLNFGNNLKFFKNYSASIYGAGQTGSASKNDATQYDQTLDNIFNYSHNFGKHNFNITAVYGYNKSDFNRTVTSGTGFSDLNLSYNSLQQAEIQKISSEAWKESLLYQMGSIAYNYGGKYLIKATIRRDGFSGFSQNNKTGIFPSVGLGWVISEENFFKKIRVIDYLKIRGSYGENGNKVSRYSSLARVSSDDASKYVFGDGGLTSIGRSVATLANADLKWERTRGINIGLDYAILNNRIDGNIEYYNSNTYDLLWQKTLPQTSGFQNVFTNLGQINNSGFEFMIHGTPLKTKDFKWDITLNFTRNRNKVVSILGEDKNNDGIEDDLVASGLFIGKPIGTIYDYEVKGIYQLADEKLAGFQAGTYKFNDLNGDGKITAADDRKILGNKEAAYQFGIQNTFSYKQFSLRAFINSVQGGSNSYLSANYPYGYNGTSGNATNSNWFDFTDFWSPRNPNGKYPNPWVSSPAGGRQYFQRNFVRLQDISLSYSLTDKVAKKIGATNAKIFVSGKNLFTFTKWDGWDPETNTTLTPTDGSTVNTALGVTSINAFPVLKSYSLGLEITF
ncbi:MULTISPECIES: TonB-dependent receptor [unclassified Arcicella]|uniref:SusC/RagA family TonB-linked outer membrane protein n=1 Tax=unclassified Arcicella TaxID=2644986 RepID=UPI00285F5F31|nr:MULTISPECIES: TonB-dependent receptor [unclassified Arcicella]MDR6562285.1 TonB-linked SusC/RagA family outer membrane protein [Arcicella sp. BE51]MDR6812021.1 TonB-linked SusC/RagA family outer membrane protein [Arcicella sp. BE140]MDR6823332.1 TonB-linked SusC/RagA family outer membrane protein [Arcicella sp. BE139]